MTPDGSTRWLLLLRHAKSAWPDVPDHERPLARRGRRQAPLVGAWLRTNDFMPDLVLCSTARRARETWQLVGSELGMSPDVSVDERIYGAAGSVLLDLVRQAPRTVTTLLLVGHEPGIPELTRMLLGGRPAASAGEALQRMRAKFPTGAVAVLAVPGFWRDIGSGSARLADFVVPRDLES